MTNKNNNKGTIEQDDDPTAELKILSEEAVAKIRNDVVVELDMTANAADVAGLDTELCDARSAIANLKSEIQ